MWIPSGPQATSCRSTGRRRTRQEPRAGTAARLAGLRAHSPRSARSKPGREKAARLGVGTGPRAVRATRRGLEGTLRRRGGTLQRARARLPFSSLRRAGQARRGAAKVTSGTPRKRKERLRERKKRGKNCFQQQYGCIIKMIVQCSYGEDYREKRIREQYCASTRPGVAASRLAGVRLRVFSGSAPLHAMNARRRYFSISACQIARGISDREEVGCTWRDAASTEPPSATPVNAASSA